MRFDGRALSLDGEFVVFINCGGYPKGLRKIRKQEAEILQITDIEIKIKTGKRAPGAGCSLNSQAGSLRYTDKVLHGQTEGTEREISLGLAERVLPFRGKVDHQLSRSLIIIPE